MWKREAYLLRATGRNGNGEDHAKASTCSGRVGSKVSMGSSRVENDEVEDSQNTQGASGSAGGDRGYDAGEAVGEVGLTHKQKQNKRRRLMHEARRTPFPDN